MNNKLKLSLVQLLIIAISIYVVVVPTALANGNPSNPPPPSGFVPNSTIRIYGDDFPQGNAPERYDYWQEPFNPTIIPKDSITFNPAILNWGTDFPMSAGSVDSDLKTYLRAWYEPMGWYKGPRKDVKYPTINLEYTLMLLNDSDKLPWDGSAGNTWFAFPITGNHSQTGLALYENNLTYPPSLGPAKPNLVNLSMVSGIVGPYNKTVMGTIRIEKKYFLGAGDSVQFLDHKLQYVGTDLNGNNAIVRVWYTGNLAPDTPSIVILPMNQTKFFKRHNEMRDVSEHPSDGGEPISWYANFEFKMQDHEIAIDVGKELDYSDVFYVNGVRYDVAAVEVLDNIGSTNASLFKYITLRTKLPKCVGTVPDESVVTSQWLDCIAVNETLPVLPPFNMNHAIVDDINIPLWRPLKHQDQWPVGDTGGQIGIEKFPEAEKFLTMQYPPANWTEYFRVVPIGAEPVTDESLWAGPYYPGNDLPPYWRLDESQGLPPGGEGVIIPAPSSYKVFKTSSWIAMNVKKRTISNVDPLMVYYIAETIEQRLSTDLLEVLNETNIGEPNLIENWTKFDIQTLPDQYTEFVLPSVPDLNVSGYSVQNITNYSELPGDYLITTSLIAPNSIGERNVRGGDFPNGRVAFAFDQSQGSDGKDIYINANKFDSSKNVTLRIYGDLNPSAPTVYENWQDPFDPTSIRKDSITFDAAILNWSSAYPMSANSTDSDVKTYFRMYYEPLYEFKKVELPAIVTETTYMLIDDQDKLPWHGSANNTWFAFPIAEDPSTTQIGLELFENNLSSGSYAATPNLTKLAGVSGTVNDSYNKTLNGTIRLEKKYYLEDPSVGGTTIQFLDHKLTFQTTSEDGKTAVVDISYAGNEVDDTAETFNLNQSTTYYIGRHGPLSLVPIHGGSNPTTWYVHFEFKTQDHKAAIDVGKELSRGDIFYVDSVRYEVPAIEVLDNSGDTSADLFKYITIRTPFPKDPTNSTFTTQTIDDGLCTVGDCVTPGIGPSSQEIHKIPPSQWLPVLPPLNMQHSIIDDTDVVLWAPLKHTEKWPYGDPLGKLDVEKFPKGERYLTQQNPPAAWLRFFRAIPIGVPGVPHDWQLWDSYGGPFYPDVNFDSDAWIAKDVRQRIAGPIPALKIYWVNETWEERYSTNLLEILNETITGTSPIVENWTKYDIQTLPDMYTEFKLPVIPSVNPSVYISGDFQNYYNPDMREYPGSYIVTTSFIAPNALGDLYNLTPPYRRYAFTFNASNGVGLYINEDPVPEAGVTAAGTINLQPGVQYISAPQIPAVADPVSVFGPDVTVWGYDPVNGWYYPTAIEGGKGYYVFSLTAKSVSVDGANVEGITWDSILPSLRPGWNLIGPGNSAVSVGSLPSNILAIFGYNPASGWYPVTTGQSFQPGNGYWILVGP